VNVQGKNGRKHMQSLSLDMRVDAARQRMLCFAAKPTSHMQLGRLLTLDSPISMPTPIVPSAQDITIVVCKTVSGIEQLQM